MEHEYEPDEKVYHKQYGLGSVAVRISRSVDKQVIKDTYVVDFVSGGKRTVKQKDLRKATVKEWTSISHSRTS